MGDSSSSSEDVGASSNNSGGNAAPSGASGAGGSSSTSAAASGAALDSEEQDMGRLQAMLEARGFPPHLAGVLGPRMHHFMLNRGAAAGPSSASAKAHSLLGGL
eukprot:TRINITY_DN26290_c0_g1_i1.p2 TRINITY_DN26290_c0_g1~~TRINITY_DN26290_c0_g1_i1.p2  ORF type:complete len:104 (-),score=44.23 TRINITY_DN26290_c0_g1_i1:1-312(-)